MKLGQVVGNVWSTVKDERLTGHRLVVVQPVKPDRTPVGKRLICTDATGAGMGDLVYYVGGMEAALPWPEANCPTDATIVGLVDTIRCEPLC